MTDRDWVAALFESIDARDAEGFSSFLDDNCTFRFGNLPAVSGAANIRDFVAGFFDSIAAVDHQVAESWSVPDGVVCHGEVSYRRLDDSVLTVPFSNILKTRDGRIHEYMIFADISGL